LRHQIKEEEDMGEGHGWGDEKNIIFLAHLSGKTKAINKAEKGGQY
jgi:hypothetical protein